MILLHGAGIDGDIMINTFQNTANTYQCVIIPYSLNHQTHESLIIPLLSLLTASLFVLPAVVGFRALSACIVLTVAARHAQQQACPAAPRTTGSVAMCCGVK